MLLRDRRFLPYASCLLGVLSLLSVLCFHFPELLTSQEFRAVYTREFARNLLLVGLVAAFVSGRSRSCEASTDASRCVGLGGATLAVLLGGTDVQFDNVGETPYSLGLDWFMLSLFFSALVFIPLEQYFARRQVAGAPARVAHRRDLLLHEPRARAVHPDPGHRLYLHRRGRRRDPGRAGPAIGSLPCRGSVPARRVRGRPRPSDLCTAATTGSSTLWRFHSVHHSSRDLDWLAGSRVHLVETVLTRSIVLLPLMVLGFSHPGRQRVRDPGRPSGGRRARQHRHPLRVARVRAGAAALPPLAPRAAHRLLGPATTRSTCPSSTCSWARFKLPTRRQLARGVRRLHARDPCPQGIVAQHLMPFRGEREYADYVA